MEAERSFETSMNYMMSCSLEKIVVFGFVLDLYDPEYVPPRFVYVLVGCSDEMDNQKDVVSHGHFISFAKRMLNRKGK